ncbi:MAG: DNA-3-methyladenine glycosylase [bacterium]
MTGEQIKQFLHATIEGTGQRWFIPDKNYYLRPTEKVAQDIIGCLLVVVNKDKVCGGKIVEAEAYLGETDPACHAARGITPITEIFYKEGGVAYVFHAYGVWHCFNVIVCPAGIAGCVLVRALEPMFGIDEMVKRRNTTPDKLRNLCSGPGKLCQALGIETRHSGFDLRKSDLLILAPDSKSIDIVTGPRIGINKARDWQLRYCVKDSLWLSRKGG